MRKLLIVDDEGRRTTVPLVRSEVTIGRQEGNTIRLTERNVSRHHARIYREGVQYFVEDQSRYGTRKNGRKLDVATRFEEGDIIVIGTYKLELSSERSDVLDPDLPPEELETTRLGTADLHTVPTPPRQEAESAREASSTDSTPPISPGRASSVSGDRVPRGRLVCMTEPFMGSEFVFTADSLTIGTAADCDLIIEHRSIAPHHARFDHTAGSYSIRPIDAGYPVALNGKYSPTGALKSGDEVLLGELKFRFALPGENLHMLPLDDIDEELSPGGRPAWFLPAMVVAGVVLLLLVVVLVSSGGGEGEVVAEAPTPTPPVLEANDANGAMERGRAHMTGARWSEALAEFSSVPEDAAERELAMSLSARAQNELANQTHYDAALRAFDEGDYEQTLRELALIPVGTHYRTRAADDDLERRAVNSVVDSRIAASQAAQDDGDIGEAIRVLVEIQPLAPGHAALGARIEQLRAIGDTAPADERERGRSRDDERAAARADSAREERERERDEERAEAREEERAAERAADARREREDEAAAERESERTQVAVAEPDEEPDSRPGRDLDGDDSESRQERARELRQQAARAGVQQNFQEAIRLLEEARELNPGDPQINLMLFSNYRQVGNRSRAARAIRRYLRQRPDDPRRSEYEEWLAENAPE